MGAVGNHPVSSCPSWLLTDWTLLWLLLFRGHVLVVQVLLETNTAGNLQLVVQVAKEYTEQLGAGKIMELLESHKSYHGLYYYLGGHIAFSEDPEVHYKYIEAAAKTGQLKEVERVTRESAHYPPERVKQFLMEAKLPDARWTPLPSATTQPIHCRSQCC